MAAAAGIVMFVLFGGLGANRRGNFDQLAAGRFQPELDVGGVDQMFHQHEGVARALADGEQAMIVHDHRAVLCRGPD